MASGKAAQGFMQSGGGNPEGQRLHSLSGTLSHCLTVPGAKEFPFVSSQSLSCFGLCLFSHSAVHLSTELGSNLTVTSSS